MRVSTASTYEASVAVLQRRQQELSASQLQLTSGKKISKPSDDPTGAARAERALIEQTRSQTTLRSLDASRNAMTLAESGLGSAVNLVQSAREALVGAGNGTYSASDRATLAVQLRQMRSQLLTVANQQDGAGGYLFGGQGAQSAPFLDGVGGVTSAATSGQLNASANERLPLSVDGDQAWLQARSGNGVFETSAASTNTGSSWIGAGQVTNPSALQGQAYKMTFANNATTGALEYSVTLSATGAPATDASGAAITGKPFQSGKAISDIPGMSFAVTGTPAVGDSYNVAPSQPNLSVFKALDQALGALENPNANGGQVMQAVQNGLRDMDQVLSNMSSARSTAGATLNQLDGLEGRTNDRILSAKTIQSNAEDLDMAQGISEFSNKQSSYQAALQSYSQVQKLSLFNYIGN